MGKFPLLFSGSRRLPLNEADIDYWVDNKIVSAFQGEQIRIYVREKMLHYRKLKLKIFGGFFLGLLVMVILMLGLIR